MRSTAVRIAVRDLRASWTKFLFVVLAVAAGVGALTGVRGFSESFRAMLLGEARTLMAADIFARIYSHPTEQQIAAIDSLVKRGVVHTQVTETLSMVGSDAVAEPALVTLKAVDSKVFPIYGQVETNPPSALSEALTPTSVLISSDLQLRLQANPGDQLRIGGHPFRVAGILVKEPDRMSGSFSVGPRLLITREALERTGLVGLGSRASQRLLFGLRPGSPDVVAVEMELRRAFPEALVVNYREINPNVARGLARATTFLSLVSLIALIVGAIGVATAMHAHLQTRMDSIAIMKSVGGRSSQIIRIYVMQTLFLGLAGGVLGVIGGLGVQRVFPILMDRFLQVQPANLSITPGPALQGLALGVLTTLLFTLPPLLGIRDIRPALIFRRDMADVRQGWRKRLRQGRANLIVGLFVSIGIAGLAATIVAGSWQDAARIGAVFVAALLVSLLALAAVGTGLLRTLQHTVSRAPGLPVTLRHAIANLYRPGSQSRSVLTALGVGVMLTLTVYLVQRSVIDEIRRSAPPEMANVFFIDITADQKDELERIIRAQPGVERPPEIIATVSCRLQAVNGVPIEQVQLQRGAGRRVRMARNISIERNLPAGTEILRGAWWTVPEQPQISVGEGTARSLNLEPGSTMTWNAFGRTIEARVASIHRSDERRLRGMLEFYMSPGALEGLPTVYYAAARMKNDQIGRLQTAVYKRFPTVTVINVADILDRVQEVVDQIALVVRFLSGFAIFAGAIILASSVAGTRLRRVREMAIFKTLGATRGKVAQMFSTEFLILGATAGLIGSLLATGFTWVLLRRFFDETPFRFDPIALAVAIAATAIVASAAGWLASFRILGQKPLEVLRSE